MDISIIKILLLPVMLVVVTPPIGATILGCAAISRIRHSQGRLYGLGFALFAALLYPLLFVDAAIVVLWMLVLRLLVMVFVVRPGPGVMFHFVPAAVPAVLAVVVVDVLLVRWAWRAAKKPVGGAPLSSVPPVVTSPTKKSAWGTIALVLVLAAIPASLLVGWFGHLDWAAIIALCLAMAIAALIAGIIGWRSIPGKIAVVLAALLVLVSVPVGVYVGLRSAKSAAVRSQMMSQEATAVAARQRVLIESRLDREIRRQLQQRSNRFDGLSVKVYPDRKSAYIALSNLQEMRGIGGTNGWVTLNDSLSSLTARDAGNGRWEVRGSGGLGAIQFTVSMPNPTAMMTGPAPPLPNGGFEFPLVNPAVRVPVTYAFGPVTERVLTDNGLAGGRIYLDFETGRVIVENGAPDLDRIRRDGRDLQLDLAPGQERLVELDLLAAGAADSFWQNAPAEAVVDTLTYAIAHNGLQSGTEISLSGNVHFPCAYMFRTREGTYGLAQIDGFTDHPRGVKIRYKLVQRQPIIGPVPRLDSASLTTRLDAAALISSFVERDQALTSLARDAADAGDADVVRKALAGISSFVTRDQAAQDAARRLAKQGRRNEAIEVARSISSFVTRDATLAEFSR